ncbi:MAG: toll/interleukin-1 receptor domain-containing protein [Chitinophagaceae bacterium]|nr:toll/interleukin-1 receptor domain-containing protein [Chitinophagaceae bacterium]
MSAETNYYLIYSELDKQLALELVQKLEDINVWTTPVTELIKPGYLIDYFKDAVLIVLLSSNSSNDKIFQFQINYAIENHLVIITVQKEQCIVPQGLQKMVPFDYQYLLTNQREKFFEMAGIPQWVNLSKNVAIDDYPAQSYPTYSEQSFPKKSIFKSIIESINPFKKSKEKSIFDGLDKMTGSIAGTSNPSRAAFPQPAPQQTSSGAEPPENPAAFEPYQSIDTRPRPIETGTFGSTSIGGVNVSDLFPDDAKPIEQQAELVPENPGKGKVLYDIPENMTVNVQHTCLVRVGKNEAIVLDDDTFSPAVKIISIPISKVMEVDMVDVSDQPRFNIKKISSIEQLVDDDSYSEWIFMVTPLTGGVYPLLLKVSVIKIIDGK